MKRYLLKILLVCFTSVFYTAILSGQDINEKMFPNIVISKKHYIRLREELMKEGDNPYKTMFDKWIKKYADDVISKNSKPITCISRKNNPNKVNTWEEMKKIYYLCVTYAFYQEQKYLDKAIEYLVAWGKVNIADPKENIHEENYTWGVEGYSLIRNVISEEDRVIIDNWMRKRVEQFEKDNDLRRNNWGTCLLRQYYQYGLVLNDQKWINKFKSEYPEWVKGNLFPNGTTTDLLMRDAFAYHAYNLLFFARMARLMAIYEGYDAADSFYSQDIRWGASIKKSVDFWKPFILNPEKYKHVEFVGTNYAPDKQRDDYNKLYDPKSTLSTIDELYEFDPSIKKIYDKYRQGNELATWRSTLGALRWICGD